ncbi:MAG TPA: molybdopterin-dependent oxidoreductase, partial [Chloroflexota bacterium]|nr:molybdopterin-dependent oxidoreductase [Chloroflexota bacterium]
AKLIIANPRSAEADRLAFRRLRHRPGAELALLQALAAALVQSPPMVTPPPVAQTEGQEAAAPPEPQPRDLSNLRTALGNVTVEQAAQAAGVTADAIQAAAAALAGANRPVIYAGSRLALRADAEGLAAALVSLAEALGNRRAVGFFPDGPNGRGAAFAGLVPGEGGLPAGEIIAQAAEGTIKALYLAGENVLETHPDREQAQRALENAELVIVHELFPTDTARMADVVFSATPVAEKDGSLTNAEGRIQRIHRAVITDAGGPRPDWRILADLSAEMGAALGYAAATEVTRDLLADLPVYAATGGKLPAEGIICHEYGSETDGTEGGVSTGRTLPSIDTVGGTSVGAASGGLTLITYAELLGDETVVRATPELLEMVPAPYVEVNRADAERLGLVDGQFAELATERGSVTRLVRVNGRCPEGVCYTPENVGQPRVNAIMNWNTPLPTVRLTPVREPVAAG